jgi:hypothetical protein
MPWVGRQYRANRVLVGGRDDQQRVSTPIHESSVFVPARSDRVGSASGRAGTRMTAPSASSASASDSAIQTSGSVVSCSGLPPAA